MLNPALVLNTYSVIIIRTKYMIISQSDLTYFSLLISKLPLSCSLAKHQYHKILQTSRPICTANSRNPVTGHLQKD